GMCCRMATSPVLLPPIFFFANATSLNLAVDRVKSCVGSIDFMAAFTEASSLNFYCRRVSAMGILPRRYHFQVIRIDTFCVATQMIDLESFGDFSFIEPVANAVSVFSLAAFVPHLAVSAHKAALPFPASTFCPLDFFVEPSPK